MKSAPAKKSSGRRRPRATGKAREANAPLAAQLASERDQLAAAQLELELDTLRDELSDLELSRQQYADLYDFAPIGYLSLDQHGCIQGINLTGARMLGQRRQNLQGKPLLPLVVAEDRRKLINHLALLRRGQKEASTELQIGMHGPPVPVQLVSAQDRQNRFGPRYKTVIVDLTERKRGEAALRESEERFRLMADSAPVMIGVSGADRRRTYFNQGWLDFTGRTLEQQTGVGWAEAVHPDDREQCLANYEAAFAKRQPIQMEFRLRRHDGEYRWVLTHSVPRFTPTGEFLGYIDSGIEITERKQVEAAVHAAAAQLRLITDVAPVMLTRCSRDLRYLFVNQAYADFLGLPRDQIVGRPIREVLGETAFLILLPHMERVLAGHLVECETELPRAQARSRYLHAAYSPEWDTNGNVVGCVAALTDITERKHDERRIQVRDAVTRELAEAATLEAAAPVVLRILCEMTGWDVGALWLVAEGGRVLWCEEFWHRPELPMPHFEADTRKQRLDEDTGGCSLWEVWRTGVPQIIPDLRRQSNFLRARTARQDGLNSGFLFPIKLDEKVLGVIECYSRQQREPDSSLLKMLASVGDKLGQFIGRKHAEAALRQSEERMRRILETTLDAVVTIDPGGSITGWNPPAEQIFGWGELQAIGRKFTELIFPPRFRAAFQQALQRYLDTGSSAMIEKRIELTAMHRDGHELPVELAIAPVVMQDHFSFCAFMRDITESKAAEAVLRRSQEELERLVAERTRDLTKTLEALLASETRFRGLVESAPDAIVIANETGRIVLINAQTERLFGYARHEIEGRRSDLLIPKRFRSTHRSHRERSMAGSGARSLGSGFELCGLRKDGTEFPVEINLGRLHTPDGKLLCSAIRDITERKRVEDALRQSREHYLALFKEARTAQAAARKFATLVLHAQENERKRISRELHDDVGQNLTAVNMAVTSLKKIVSAGGALEAARLDELQKMLERSMEMVHSFARELRPSMLDELGLVPALRSQLQNTAALSGLKVQLRADPEAEQLGSAEKLVLFRVTQESLNNVVKHAQASRVRVAVLKTTSGITLSVADNGKSFGPANNGKSPTQRLGLLGMRERVRLVKGQFTILPRPGKGTRVRVTIPLKPAAALTAAPGAESSPSA